MEQFKPTSLKKLNHRTRNRLGRMFVYLNSALIFQSVRTLREVDIVGNGGTLLIMSTQTEPLRREILVVTGASTGIGAATARELARRGFHVLAGVR